MFGDLKSLGLIWRSQNYIPQLKQNHKLLGKVLRFVEIETHNYCNRTCSFCPNSYIDRRSSREYFPPHSYIKILKELADIKFSGTISYNRYMEPLADEVIFDRVREAHEWVPKARLIINTNGDFFNQSVLNRLERAGLNELNIARYIDTPQVWTNELAIKRCEDFAKKHGLDVTRTLSKPDHVFYKVHHSKMTFSLYSFNYVTTKYNRAGSLAADPFVRKSPCVYPFAGLYFDSNGECLPCCNMRSDVAGHKPFIYGNIETHSLLELFQSRVARSLRQDLAGFSEVEPDPCQGCAHRIVKSNTATKAIWSVIQRKVTSESSRAESKEDEECLQVR
jgi:hypothetical protein